MSYTGPVPPVTWKDKLLLRKDRLDTRVRTFFTKPENDNSGIGKAIQGFGVLSALAGLYLVYPPLAYLSAGIILIVLGEHL